MMTNTNIRTVIENSSLTINENVSISNNTIEIKINENFCAPCSELQKIIVKNKKLIFL